MPIPTPAEKATLDEIRAYIAEWQMSPTMQELAEILGVSKTVLFERVECLAKSIVLNEKCPCCGRG